MAPSPTGLLHIGTARTALFNYLTAKHYGGKFVLRIEDTDLERSTKEFEKNIIDGLKWLGINWDEGPDIGGPYAPYNQNDRRDIYKKYLQQLLDEGKAYYCFCTQEELEIQKQEMITHGEAPRYIGRCAELPPETVQKYLAAGKPSVIRFRMPKIKISFKDIIRKEVKTDLNLIGDIVIAKNLNEPLYNFSVVIDDHLMDISLVIRGEDHITNTPKQIALYKAFDWDIPMFAHLPLILNSNKTKLSKRDNIVSIDDYRQAGYLPQAIVNFIALLGWHDSSGNDIFSLEDLIQKFTLTRIQKSGAIFNLQKLDFLNKHYISLKPKQELIEEVLNYGTEFNFITLKEGSVILNSNNKSASMLQFTKYIETEQTRVNKYSDFFQTNFLFTDLDYLAEDLCWKDQTKEEAIEALDKSYHLLYSLVEEQFDLDIIKIQFEELIKYNEKYKLNKGLILWPLRMALSGLKYSPSPYELLAVLGREESLRRIKIAQDRLAAV